MNSQPLSEEEIEMLAVKKRDKAITQYFKFDRRQLQFNTGFEKTMKSEGCFYRLEELLHIFPAYVGYLLKYKKHRWIVVAFENSQKIELMWSNKGTDIFNVSLKLSHSDLINKAKKNGANSILVFINHPNWDPQNIDLIHPSDYELTDAQKFSDKCISNGLNCLHFICERGRYNNYHTKCTESFLSLDFYEDKISRENGHSKYRNMILHTQLNF
ncbi:MAG: hypothetical protein ACRC6R_06790 [Bacteroidales bacterium]